MPQTPADITGQYDAAVSAAAAAYKQAEERMNALQAQIDAIPSEDVGDGTGPRAGEAATLTKQLDRLQQTYGTAQQEYTQVLHQRADAVTKAKDDADPAKRASLEAQAKADIAKANQIDLESKEYTEAAPERRATAKDASRLGKAKADEAEYALAVEKETDPIKKQAAQAALDQAKVQTATLTKALGQVEINTTAPMINDPDHPGQLMKNKNYIDPNAKLTTGQAATDAAVASTAEGSAAAALRTAQAGAATAEATLAEAQRRLRQSPTDEQAQRAVDTAQKGLDLANDTAQQALDQTKALAKGQVAQQGATLEGTQAATDASREATAKGKQGDLYGLQDKIKQIRDLIASGEVKPQDGDSMIAAAQRGTDIYSVLKQQQSDKDTARQQDITNKGNLASNFTSTFNNSLSEFQKMNQTGAVGSDATGKAFLATLGLAQDYLKSYEQPAATPTDYLGTMVDQAQKQMAGTGGAAGVPPLPGGLPPTGLPPLPAAPAPGGSGLLPAGMTGTAGDPLVANSPAHTQPITINIGGGQPATPSYMNGAGPGPVNAGGPPPPPPNYMNGAGPGPVNSPQGQGDRLAAAASQATMATKGEVIKTLFPRHAAQIGL